MFYFFLLSIKSYYISDCSDSFEFLFLDSQYSCLNTTLYYSEQEDKDYFVELLQMVEKYKTIKISEQTYHKLSQLGTLSDSFDSVIKNLIHGKQKENTNV